MRVLVFHGYLLRGTGSNIYNASLVPALARLGHDVHLLCQDRYASELPWVDRFGEWRDGAVRGGGAGGDSPRGGSLAGFLSRIRGLLPRLVKDRDQGGGLQT